MSKKRYRRKPGMPRTETDAMVRAMAIEMLDSSLAELEQEISVLKITVDLYYAEALERKNNPTKEFGRWQVAPGVAIRANAQLRRLREKRDEMLGEAEREILEEAHRQNAAEAAKTKAPADPQPTNNPGNSATTSTAPTSQGVPEAAVIEAPARSRDPAVNAA